MNKKFVNLPSNYKNFLNSFSKKIDNKSILDIANQKINYDDICSIHDKIDKISKENGCTDYDINKMIRSYGKDNKENNKINLLKKIASIRNRYIVSNSANTKLWNKNLNDLKQKIKKIDRNCKVTDSDIEKAFVDLLTKYKYDWNGLWSIFNVNKTSNKVDRISVFDIEDFDFIVEKLGSKKLISPKNI